MTAAGFQVGIHVDVVADLHLAHHPARCVDRDRHRPLVGRELRGEPARPREVRRSELLPGINICKRDAVVQGCRISDRKQLELILRHVGDLVHLLLRNERAGRPSRDEALRDEHLHRSSSRIDARTVRMQVDDEQDRREISVEDGTQELVVERPRNQVMPDVSKQGGAHRNPGEALIAAPGRGAE